MAWGSARLALTATTILGNSANDGGGIALLQDSTLEISASTVSMNKAWARGGGLYVGPGSARVNEEVESSNAAASVTILGDNVFTSNMASLGDGGAVYAHRMITFAPGGLTTVLQTLTLVQGNAAPRGRGGGLTVRQNKMQIEPGHIIDIAGNSAQSGGGVALLDGASVSLGFETCTADCEPAKIGDGTCNPECFNRACVWDGGDCRSRLQSAGADATRACPRAECGAYSQTSTRASAYGCESGCFTASCDWSRSTCQDPRDAIRQCPLLDGMVFSSIRAQQQQSGAPVFMRDGNSGNFGRCNRDGCQKPVAAPGASALAVTPGRVGAAALRLSGRNGGWLSVGLETQSIRSLESSKKAAASGVTVEAWIRPEVGGDTWPATNEWKPQVTCSGDCPCTPSSGTTFGTFSDGPGDYANNQNCKWLVASPGLISLSFTLFDTYPSDTVSIKWCTSAPCNTVEKEVTLLGRSTCLPYEPCKCTQSEAPVSPSAIYTSSTGFLQVVFTSNGDGCSGSGFVALWNTTRAGQGSVGFVLAGATLAVGVLKHGNALSVLVLFFFCASRNPSYVLLFYDPVFFLRVIHLVCSTVLVWHTAAWKQPDLLMNRVFRFPLYFSSPSSDHQINFFCDGML